MDIAALLIKYNTCVNATDKWAFTPLHEAAQKGRTQLCALLLAHGADPTMKNQEGQTPLDLATVRTFPSSSVLRSFSRWHQDDFLSCLDEKSRLKRKSSTKRFRSLPPVWLHAAALNVHVEAPQRIISSL